MKQLIVFALIAQLSGVIAFAQPKLEGQQPTTQQTPSPASKKVIVQTPFGPKEYDVTDVPPGTQTTPAAAAAPATETPAPLVPPVAPPNPAAAAPAPSQAAPVTVPPAQGVEGPPVVLSFDNADLYAVIKTICNLLTINCVIDPGVKGTVNVNAAEGFHRSDLLPVLETLLKMNADTMVKVGNFYEIVPASSAVRQPLEVQERQPLTNPDDQMVLQIIRMKYVPAGEMKNLLGSYLSEGASIVVQESGNILLITERRSNLRKLLQIVDIFDANVLAEDRVRVLPVKNNPVREVVADLNSVFSGLGLTQGTSAIHFMAIDRLNSVLVISPNPSVFPQVEKWLNNLDQTALASGLRNYEYSVKNVKATDIQSVLSQLYGGGQVQTSSIYNQPSGNQPSGAAGSPQPAAPPQTPTTNNPLGVGSAGVPASLSGSNGRPNLRIVADPIHNKLFIQAEPQVYREMESLIEEIDVLPRQVMVDARIFEVTLDDSLSLGISAYLQNKSTLTTAQTQTSASFAGAAGGVPSLAAQAFTAVSRTNALVGFLNASENRSRVRTLSAPSVMVSDNGDADFQVGADVPIPTSSSVTPVTSGGTNLFAQTITYAQTGVLLHVKPRINEGGNVSLDISQEVSEAGANTTSAVVAPVIGKSAVKTSVSVQDGQTIAIGGFIRENNELDRNRLPLVGRIPYLGNLFGNTTKDTSRTELIVLITPHVIRTHEDADVATEELKAKLREVQKLLN